MVQHVWTRRLVLRASARVGMKGRDARRTLTSAVTTPASMVDAVRTSRMVTSASASPVSQETRVRSKWTDAQAHLARMGDRVLMSITISFVPVGRVLAGRLVTLTSTSVSHHRV